MVFNKKKRKNILDNKKYRMGRPIRYKNPLRIKNNVFKSKIFKIVNIILILGIGISIYFFIFSDFYVIDNIEVNGNEIISSDDLLDIVNETLNKRYFLLFKNNNIFIYNRKYLKQQINEKIILEDIKIEKILPNTIRLTVKEKNAVLKWVNNGQEYLVDQNGIIIKRFYKESIPEIFRIAEGADNERTVASNKNENYLIIKNLDNKNLNIGDQVLNEQDIYFIKELTDKLSKINYLKIRGISVPNNFPKYIEIEIEPKWSIFFNMADSVDNQINRLEILVKNKISEDNLSNIEYIDLRLGESVYYK